MNGASISVLVRSMDRPTLGRALDSAARQLRRPDEIVVVVACGAAHSALPSHWNGVPLRLIPGTEPRRRAAAANAALDAARGEWLNFLDDDDELLPEHLGTLLGALESNPGQRLAYALTEVRDASREHAGVFGARHHRIELLQQSKFHLMGALFHRSLLADGARFDQQLDISEDNDFWIQCAQHTPFLYVDAITSVWHAFIGSSGAGGGANLDPAASERAHARISAKWALLANSWDAPLEVLRDTGMFALRMARYRDASVYLERAERLAPNDPHTVYHAGIAAFMAGDATRAIALLERASFLDPDAAPIRRALERARRHPAGKTP